MAYQKRCWLANTHGKGDVDVDEQRTISSRSLPKHLVQHMLQSSGKTLSKYPKDRTFNFCIECVEKAKQALNVNEQSRSTRKINLELDHSYSTNTHDDTFISTSCQTESLYHVVYVDGEVSDVLLSLKSLGENEILKLSNALGILIREKIKQRPSRNEASLTIIKDINIVEYMSNVEQALSQFLVGVSGIQHQPPDQIENIDNQDKKIYYKLCKTAESVLDLSYIPILLPIHFRESVLTYSITGSKLVLQVLSQTGPYSSYNVVKQWLANLSNDITIDPEFQVIDEDILVAFDNNQILSKTWSVSSTKKFKCNVCTMICSFTIGNTGKQNRAILSPKTWNDSSLSDGQTNDIKYPDECQQIKELFSDEVNNFIQTRIAKVVNEQRVTDSGLRDPIDDKVVDFKFQQHFKSCQNCGVANSKRKRICGNCKTKLIKSDVQPDKTEDLARARTGTKRKKNEVRYTVKRKINGSISITKLPVEEDRPIKMQNQGVSSTHVYRPSFNNPCSYNDCEQVLLDIGNRSGIKQYGGTREWVVVVCDGVPYNLCQRIIQCSYRCLFCGSIERGKGSALRHVEKCKSWGSYDISNDSLPIDGFKFEFTWILLIPGAGHIEMNMTKSYVSLMWDVFYKEMVKLYNFKSDVALKYAKKVSDYHKGFQLLTIARNAITDELLVPYVRYALTENQEITPESFREFITKSSDVNYKFLGETTLEILLPIFMYRQGTRKQIPEIMMAARSKFAKVWCGRPHPIYRELEARDTIYYNKMPKEIQSVVNNSMSINTSGLSDTGEGGDFKLEAINKRCQYWMPPRPTPKDWDIVCANFDQLEEIRARVFHDSGCIDPKLRQGGSKQDSNIDDEATVFRMYLRENGYLSNDHIESSKPHQGVAGEILDTDFHNFIALSSNLRVDFIDDALNYTGDEPTKIPTNITPIFITADERAKYESIENKTIEEIQRLIVEQLNQKDDEEMLNAWQTLSKKKRITKSELISFYEELAELENNDDDVETFELVDDNDDDE